MSESPLEVRTYRAGDEADIVEALARVQGRRWTLDEWSFRYPPLQPVRPVVVARRGGRLVGHVGAVARRLWFGGREVNAAALVDCFVLPEAADGRTDPDPTQLVGEFVERFGPGRHFDLLYELFPDDGGSAALTGVRAATTAPVEVVGLSRLDPGPSSPRRFGYRAEPGRDWEPRLDGLWQRARSGFAAAAIRDAEDSLARHGAHPSPHRHRFVVLPRFSRQAVAHVVFEADEDACRWIDLAWDHAHAGALDLVMHLSGRIGRQVGAERESVWVCGDEALRRRLESKSYRADRSRHGYTLAVLGSAEAAELAGGLYLTGADLELRSTGTTERSCREAASRS